MAIGTPRAIQMDAGAEREGEISTDFCTGRNICLQSQEKGARRWPLVRRDGLARRIYNRMAADRRFSSRATWNEVQFCLDAKLSHGGSSAYPMAFGLKPADL